MLAFLRRDTPAALAVLPVVTGGLVMQLGGAPRARLVLHAVAAAVGRAAYAALRTPRQGLAAGRGALAGGAALLALLALTFADPGITGVHRWITLGTLRIDPSALGAPALLVAAAHLEPPWARAALLLRAPPH